MKDNNIHFYIKVLTQPLSSANSNTITKILKFCFIVRICYVKISLLKSGFCDSSGKFEKRKKTGK